MKPELETIVIPSGTFEADMARLDSGVIYTLSNSKREFRYLLSGVGPNLNKRLKMNMEENGFGFDRYQTEFGEERGLDVHPELWTSAIRHVKDRYNRTGNWEPFGIDIISTNSVGNILNSFPLAQEGNYTIVSRRLHNIRFKMIERWARKKELLSPNLTINYLDTKESFSVRDAVYDILALGKELTRQLIHEVKN